MRKETNEESQVKEHIKITLNLLKERKKTLTSFCVKRTRGALKHPHKKKIPLKKTLLLRREIKPTFVSTIFQCRRVPLIDFSHV